MPNPSTPAPDTTSGALTADDLAALLARPVVSIDDSTRIVGASRSTICRAIASGDLPATKRGRRVFIATPALLAWAGAV